MLSSRVLFGQLFIMKRSTKGYRFPGFRHAGTKTCLYDFHLKHDAKMVDFAGFSMPLKYGDQSISDSVRHTRSKVSIFDCSHMMQSSVIGEDRIKFLESLTPADIVNLELRSGLLSVFINNNGGILDDLILTKMDSAIILVTNASRISQDMNYLKERILVWRNMGKDVNLLPLNNRGLIAVQGPQMVSVVQPETDISLHKLHFMRTSIGNVCGIENCRVTRCGYTGEDGIEISVDGDKASQVVEKLLASKNGSPLLAGLGTRDVLRLEAGLCLYGSDISVDTTPVEAGLSFVIGKRRRQTLGFPGAQKIVEQIGKKNAPKKRVGLVSEGGRIPRAGMEITDPETNRVVGTVTSGCLSPNLEKNIAMGYVDKEHSTDGKILNINFKGKNQCITITKLPFIKTKYYIQKTDK